MNPEAIKKPSRVARLSRRESVRDGRFEGRVWQVDSALGFGFVRVSPELAMALGLADTQPGFEESAHTLMFDGAKELGPLPSDRVTFRLEIRARYTPEGDLGIYHLAKDLKWWEPTPKDFLGEPPWS